MVFKCVCFRLFRTLLPPPIFHIRPQPILDHIQRRVPSSPPLPLGPRPLDAPPREHAPHHAHPQQTSKSVKFLLSRKCWTGNHGKKADDLNCNYRRFRPKPATKCSPCRALPLGGGFDAKFAHLSEKRWIEIWSSFPQRCKKVVFSSWLLFSSSASFRRRQDA